MATPHREPPSLGEAFDRVIESGQRLLADRLELLRLEAKEDVYNAGRGISFVFAAVVLGFYGWLTAIALVVYLLWGTVPMGWVLGAVTLLHLGVGAVLGRSGVATLRAIRPLRPDAP